MRADVLVVRVPFVGGAVALIGLVQLALTEIDIGQLQVHMRLVEVMNIGLQLLDLPPIRRARQLEPGHRIPAPGSTIDQEIIDSAHSGPRK